MRILFATTVLCIVFATSLLAQTPPPDATITLENGQIKVTRQDIKVYDPSLIDKKCVEIIKSANDFQLYCQAQSSKIGYQIADCQSTSTVAKQSDINAIKAVNWSYLDVINGGR